MGSDAFTRGHDLGEAPEAGNISRVHGNGSRGTSMRALEAMIPSFTCSRNICTLVGSLNKVKYSTPSGARPRSSCPLRNVETRCDIL